MVSASTLATYISTNWTSSPPGTITTTPTWTMENTLLVTQAPQKDVAIAAGLREISNSIEMRLSHASSTAISTLITLLRAYTGSQCKLEIIWDEMNPDLAGNYVWKLTVIEKYRE